MKPRLSRYLVRICSRWIQASYNAYVRKSEDPNFPQWWDKPWAAGAKLACKHLIPLAQKMDRDAATDQMIEEAWWG